MSDFIEKLTQAIVALCMLGVLCVVVGLLAFTAMAFKELFL